jgi:hypothetical protein
MGFNPCNRPLKIWESIWESNSQNGSSLGSVRVHALNLLHPSFMARNLVNLCFGHEPKARVVTTPDGLLNLQRKILGIKTH